MGENKERDLMPPEHQFACSAKTGLSLYYAANVDLRHKILSVAEEAGVRDASYAKNARYKARIGTADSIGSRNHLVGLTNDFQIVRKGN